MILVFIKYIVRCKNMFLNEECEISYVTLKVSKMTNVTNVI